MSAYSNTAEQNAVIVSYRAKYHKKFDQELTLDNDTIWNLIVNITSLEEALLLHMNSAMHPPSPVFAYIVTLKRPNGTLVQEEIDGTDDEHAREEALHLWAAELEDEGWELVGVKRGETRNYCT